MFTLPILDVSARHTESLTSFRPAWCRNARTRKNHRSKFHYKEDGVQYSGFKFEPSVAELQVGDAIVQEGAAHGTAPYVVEGRTRNQKLVLSRMHRGENVVVRGDSQTIQQLPEETVFYTIPFDGVVTQYATETFYIPIDFLYNETAVVDGMTRDGKYRIIYNGNVYHTNRNVSYEALYDGEQPLNGNVYLTSPSHFGRPGTNQGLVIRGGVQETPVIIGAF